MKFLSRIEEIILLAIWKLQDNAYGITIQNQVVKDTGVEWMSGAIYGPLSRLLKNGYVTSFKGETIPERGGRHKIFYKLTPEGKKKLIAIQEVNNAIWSGIPILKPE